MRQRKMRTALAALAVTVLGGCNFYYNTLPSPDDALKLIPYFDHMIKSQAPSPYQRMDIPRNTVAGTVPVNKFEYDWATEFRSGNATTADALPNPTLATAGVTLARGDTLYHTYCALCHGPTGNLGGTVGPKVGAPSLMTVSARDRSDGYLYSIIRYGRGVMGRYGDKVVRPQDRWAIVNYVRTLQAAQPLPAGGN
ncbi:MAG: cytochrome c [Gemmatimonadota bacterium]|nr:cytochrome c [Gemmatimonadota bacterium]